MPVNVSGTSTSIGPFGPQYIAADRAGNVYFPYQNTILRLDATTHVLTQAAGNGTQGFSGDNGPAVSAQLNNPNGVALDSAGNLYIADTNDSRIREVSNGVIYTVAGSGVEGFSGDNGPATAAAMSGPVGVAVDSAGNLYISDSSNERIRKVSNGVISTVAGNGTQASGGDDGPALSAQFSLPQSIALDPFGNLYIVDTSQRIRRVSSGIITTVAGNGAYGYSGDNGLATNAQLFNPRGVIADSAGNLYIADEGNNRIRKVSGGIITSVAGNGTSGYSGDNGAATSAEPYEPFAVAVDSFNNLYISDSGNSVVRKVSNGVITTVAGGGSIGDGGPPAGALLSVPKGVGVDSAGNLYIADQNANRVRKVSNGVITTVAGSGTPGFAGDNGLAASAELYEPSGVAVDSAGSLYIADFENNRIRKVSNGAIVTIAGNGESGFSGDNGPATSAQLNYPIGVAVDSAGNLYIADTNNNRIRKVSNGGITTVAGNGTPGFNGDNGPATIAELYGPRGVAVDAAGNIYIADTSNQRIRKVSNGVISTVAANDFSQPSGSQLESPLAIAVDSSGSLYVADPVGESIRKIVKG